LLSHTSGIPNYTKLIDFDGEAINPTPEEEVIFIYRNLPLNFAPGTEYEYSNSGYHLLKLIVQSAAGVSYSDALQERVLAPASMQNTGFKLEESESPGIALGYRPNDLSEFEIDELSISGGSGIHSSVFDLLAFSVALDDETLIRSASKEKMWTRVLAAYGYGWHLPVQSVERTLGRKLYFHSGRTPGYTSCFYKFPAERVTVVVLSNNVNADTCTVARNLAAIAFDEPYRTPIARRSTQISLEALDRVIGDYRLTGVEDALLKIEGTPENLYVFVDGSPTPIVFRAESGDSYFAPFIDLQLTFSDLENDRMQRISVSARGRTYARGYRDQIN